mmetsp:Transcript_17430/g.40925  ORF Transcript_17430/g.40925 Transcript_17430/m.40925 type:complete len:130 (-) Transcript_17430:108-497(-)
MRHVEDDLHKQSPSNKTAAEEESKLQEWPLPPGAAPPPGRVLQQHQSRSPTPERRPERRPLPRRVKSLSPAGTHEQLRADGLDGVHRPEPPRSDSAMRHQPSQRAAERLLRLGAGRVPPGVLERVRAGG